MSRLAPASVFLVAAILSLGLGGCRANPICLNCDTTEGGITPKPDLAQGDMPIVEVDLAGTDDMSDLGTPPDLWGIQCNSDLGVQPEVCNHVDDNCNGQVDDVDSAKLQGDPKNCGACFNECVSPHAQGLCAAGKCTMGPCQPGYYDLDKDAANGCEYSCIATPPSKCTTASDCAFGLPCSNGSCIKACTKNSDCPSGTICDPDTMICEGESCDGLDNNCDGNIDEGFNFQTDVNNCGACNNVCTFPNAVGQCAGALCSVLKCTDGYADLNKNGQDGCEYKCAVFPAKPETCNGIDDDCDGVIDNNATDVGGACDDYCPALDPCVQANTCSYPRSTCAGKCCGACTEGKVICAGGQRVCQMGLGPKLEICNNIDDNCDGQIDEGFDVMNDPLNCGSCGNNCQGTLLNAVTGCSGGKCSLITCKPGYRDLDNNLANGCETACPVNPPTVETCNGKDDDCNGIVDDALTVPGNFCQQGGPCVGAVPSCMGSKGWICNYKQINSQIEVDANGNLVVSETLCDGFDGNCNGQKDESFLNLGKACSVGQGACAGTGTFICDPATPTQTKCPAMPDSTKAKDEECNGVDDDCDGAIDERTDGPGNCTDSVTGMSRPCKGWRDPMVQVGSVWVAAYEASRTDASASAVGTGASRACAKPGVLPWAPVTWTAAAAACASILDSAGKAMHLCAETDWQSACNVGVVPPTQVWSYTPKTAATTYSNTTCNGADAGVGKAWTTGKNAACAAAQANGAIYDMSGNVAEWTNTQVVYQGTTYYRVRGGAYNNPSGGTSCNFGFPIFSTTYQYDDVGFRCCADNAP